MIVSIINYSTNKNSWVFSSAQTNPSYPASPLAAISSPRLRSSGRMRRRPPRASCLPVCKAVAMRSCRTGPSGRPKPVANRGLARQPRQVRDRIHQAVQLGEQRGVVPGQHDDGRAKADARGARRKIAEQVERRGDLSDAGEVMLDNENAVKAETLSLEHIVDVALVADAVAGRTVA